MADQREAEQIKTREPDRRVRPVLSRDILKEFYLIKKRRKKTSAMTGELRSINPAAADEVSPAVSQHRVLVIEKM